jgi:hypothetical protein
MEYNTGKELRTIRNIRLYLETTMFNYYFDKERDGHVDTVKLFEAIGRKEYEAYTSIYALTEIEDTPDEVKRGKMLSLVDEYHVTVLNISDESMRMADLYIAEKIIPEKYRTDGAHIAMASIHGLDCVLSYNFQHINRLKTKMLTGRVNRVEGYKEIIICTAREVLEDEE